MAKPRKMLGGIDAPQTLALMRLIETQSKETLAAWAADYAEERMLPIARRHGEDARLESAIAAVRAYLAGKANLRELRLAVGEARKAAQSAEDATMQAAARAISTACAVLTTPTSALGFTFYAQAAYAYDCVGPAADAATCNALAQEENERILESLRAVAVAKETNPVKVDWGC